MTVREWLESLQKKLGEAKTPEAKALIYAEMEAGLPATVGEAVKLDEAVTAKNLENKTYREKLEALEKATPATPAKDIDKPAVDQPKTEDTTKLIQEAIALAMKPVQDKLEAFETAEAEKGRKALISKALKAAEIPDALAGIVTVAGTTEDEINASVKAIKQNLVDSNLINAKAPGAGGGKEVTDTAIDDFLKNEKESDGFGKNLLEDK